jgi:hypothetical protein
MPAPFTLAQLAARVLHDLGMVGADETPSSADLEWAKETCSSEIDLMAAKSIVIWNGDEESIPNEYLTTLSRRICLAVAPSFGLSDVATSSQMIVALEKEIRAISAKPATGVVAKNEYF